MSRPKHTSVIVFDGVCVLCNGWVRFLLKHDRSHRYRFAPMQSAYGRALMDRHGLDPKDPMSFLLVDEDGPWTDSTAIARVLRSLGGVWRFASILIQVCPRIVRDGLYRHVARNRYRWFGQHTHCPLPSPEDSERFVR